MRELMEGAAQLVQRTGATIIVFAPGAAPHAAPGAPGLNGTQSSAPPTSDIALRHANARADGLAQEVDGLRGELGRMHADLQTATNLRASAEARVAAFEAGQPGGAGPALATLTQERDGLRAQVGELQGLVSQLRAAPPATAGAVPVPGVTGADPGAPEVRFATYGIEFLGLSESVVKKLGKLEVPPKNIGDLLNALEGGKIANGKEAKPAFTKDEVTEVALKAALGRVPPTARAVAPASASGASDVPAGHKDQLWMSRLAAARKKELQAGQFRAELERQRGELARLESGEKNPDTAEAIRGLTGKAHETDKMLGLFDGQVLAFIFALGLPAKDEKTGKHHTVDSALGAVGLTHLAQTPVGAGAS